MNNKKYQYNKLIQNLKQYLAENGSLLFFFIFSFYFILRLPFFLQTNYTSSQPPPKEGEPQSSLVMHNWQIKKYRTAPSPSGRAGEGCQQYKYKHKLKR
jgi:hypothetical protein